jgi:hypothetical protein
MADMRVVARDVRDRLYERQGVRESRFTVSTRRTFI